MGNTESAYDDDTRDDLPHLASSYSGSSMNSNHQHSQQPASHAVDSIDHNHQHPWQPSTSNARNSMDHNHQRAQHPTRIADNFNSLDQVISALRDAGLESSNLILGVDFTKSNEWTGRHSFNRKSLHAIGSRPNPYEQAISIIGRTLSPFDEDNLIPCFGFGDASTHDQYLFSFYPDQRYCHGFEEALARYREIVPYLKLSGTLTSSLYLFIFIF
ncbi:hypothetical protein EZV62_014887 [Acer yangbiense]|uniref:Copine C-terminal domain-containing protein n=1 Tax=Acer yangbiense TaxID=1000413 RepID=A0A5C7HU35_9ROSI|nr:hypothetical protein EZV62_014887 [Acer yangbiense]